MTKLQQQEDAAITARATDLADTIGNLQPDFGGLCNYQESIRLITAALCAVRDETRLRDAPYMQHKADCTVNLCQHCGHEEWLHDMTSDIDEESCRFHGLTFTARLDCTCGLAAIRSRAGGGGAG